mmetsp:Transcript_1537/g.2802  ORF Transcript_1537/g.2802 Transcript_1537/m.2802 type:complete len:227 (+) Transcript_1537:2126-2806(+)
MLKMFNIWSSHPRLPHTSTLERTLYLRTLAPEETHLVDKQNNLPLALLDPIHHLLQPLLELPPITSPGDQRPHIQPHQPTIPQRIRHVPRVHPLRDALGDRRLPHARIPDEHRIVLRAATQDLDGASDFGIASYHRIEEAEGGAGGEVHAEFIEGVFGVFGDVLDGGFVGIGRAGHGEAVISSLAFSAMGMIVNFGDGHVVVVGEDGSVGEARGWYEGRGAGGGEE